MTCKNCRYGLAALDGEMQPYIVCALLPPTSIALIDPAASDQRPQLVWVRPPMTLKGFCGQFKFSLLAYFGHGPRA